MAGDAEFVGDAAAAEHVARQAGDVQALPHELRFMIEVISTAAVPSSFMRLRQAACRPSVILGCMSASF